MRKVLPACASAFLLAACVTTPPPLARNLPQDRTEAWTGFRARVNSRFPVGSSESALLKELTLEHFEVQRISPQSHVMGGDNFDLWRPTPGLTCLDAM